MPLGSKFRSLWRTVAHRDRLDRDLDEELGCALEELAARHRAAGADPAAAYRRARIDLGGLEQVREAVRQGRPGFSGASFMRDIRYAWRSLTRTPSLTAILIATVALGIGTTTAMYTVVDALLLSPLPYREPDRLVFVWQDLTRAGYSRAPLAGPELQDLRERSTLFTGFGGIWANTTTLTDNDEPEQLRIGLVTADFFHVLGADAALGRTFRPGDDRSDPMILLSHPVWTRRYAADPRLVGRSILVDGRPTRVVGVMPEDFRLLLPADSAIPDGQQAWLLLPPDFVLGPRQQQFLRVVGRMKPGVRLEDAAAEVAAIGARLADQFPEYGGTPVTLYALGLHVDAMRALRPMLLGLFGGAVLLLIIACVNVASLLVTRAASRRHEIAVRIALGAGRSRVFRSCLAEGLTISCFGAALGLAVAHGLTRMLIALRPAPLSRIDAATVDTGVLGFVTALAVAWGILFSVAPVAEASRTDVVGTLQQGGRGSEGSLPYRTRAILVVVQIATSIVLLVAAGLLVRAVGELREADLGFTSDRAITFRVSLTDAKYAGPGAPAVFSRQLRERVRALPGVTGVGGASHLPFDNLPNWGSAYLPHPARDPSETGLADSRAVTPGYFETIGAQLVEGRWFTEADISTSRPVAIVDTRLAERLWHGQRASGRQLTADPGTTGEATVTVTVVGVVRHLRHRDITRDLREQIYFPAAQSFRNPMAYVVRTTTDPGGSVPDIRRIVAEIDPALPIFDVRPLVSYTSEAMSARVFAAVLATVFGGAALVLACLGAYGVTAYAVGQRRREFGIRLALGARANAIRTLVWREAGRLVLIGVPIGCVAAFIVASLMRSELHGVAYTDAAAYTMAIAVACAAMLAACWLPARRAGRINPLESIKSA
jgi:predicted permease